MPASLATQTGYAKQLKIIETAPEDISAARIDLFLN